MFIIVYIIPSGTRPHKRADTRRFTARSDCCETEESPTQGKTRKVSGVPARPFGYGLFFSSHSLKRVSIFSLSVNLISLK